MFLYNNLLEIFAARAGVIDLITYILVARLIVALRPSRTRSALFAAASLVMIAYWTWDGPWKFLLTVYLCFVAAQTALIRRPAQRRFAAVLPILFPLCALLAVETRGAGTILGFSYLAFRLAHNGYEIATGRAEWPGFFDYLAYCLFLPTLFIGPISPLSQFCTSFAERRSQTSLWDGAVRIVVGLTKVHVIAALFKQLTFSVLWKDGLLHGPEDFVISCFAELLFLYFNFSGFCDVVIAIAALAGVAVKENFDSPFSSRNLREYWTRWHITLGDVANAVVFTPTSQALGLRFGRRFSDLAICGALMATFCVIGIWHGLAYHYFFFGVAHGVGVSVVYFYDSWLKRRLGKQGRKAYLASAAVRGCGTALTFCYVSATMFLFANDSAGMERVAHEFRWVAETNSGGVMK